MTLREIEAEIRRRAQNRCEYCHLPDGASQFTLILDHIIAKKHRGKTQLLNLALCCGHCNLHKGPSIAGVDSKTGRITRLFNPRTDKWNQHFRWNGPVLVGLTPIGRTTVEVLEINRPPRVAARRARLGE
jgi:5-methylcytosine-specific restriction endonuclease McrA